MKRYSGKKMDEVLAEACKAEGVTLENLIYEVEEEKNTLFRKVATIRVYDTADMIEYAENYLKKVIEGLGLEVSLKTFYRDGVAKILIETNRNALIIGNNGSTLQALNDLVKLAVSRKYKRKMRILLDISDYKDRKYKRSIFVAKKCAKEVLKTHVDIKLDPMTPDERKKVHNALAVFKDIKTESIGDGKDRAIVIKYVGPTKKEPKKFVKEKIVETTTEKEETTVKTEE